MSDSHAPGASESAGHVEGSCLLPGCSHLHARIGSLENEVRTLHRTLRNFVHVLPRISQSEPNPPAENHLSPVNLQARFQQGNERGGETAQSDEERGEVGPGETWADIPGDQDAGASERDFPEGGGPDGLGASGQKRGGEIEDEKEEVAGGVEESVDPGEEVEWGAEEIRRNVSSLELDAGESEGPVPGEENREETEGVSARETCRPGGRKVLSISVDTEEGEAGLSTGTGTPGTVFGRASVSSGGDSSGGPVDPGINFSTSSSSPLFASPDSRPRGGIPRSNSINSFRTRGGGGRHHRRQGSFGEGVLGRNPLESNWRGPGGSPGHSFEHRPPSPENSWPQMGHSADFYQPPPGQFPGAFPAAPEMVYMPYQVFVPAYPTSPGFSSSPGFPASPGFSWSPGFNASPSFPPGHGWTASPVPRPGRLDRTTSDGALMPGPSNNNRAGSPGNRSSRRGSSGSRSHAQKGPEGRGRGRGTGGLEPQRESSAVPIPTPVHDNVPPHARGLLGSAPPSRPESFELRGPAPNGAGRTVAMGRPNYYMHARTSRSMHDLENVWTDNQHAIPMSPAGPAYACINEALTGPEEGPSPEGNYGGTGYFMPTYPKPKRSAKKRASDTSDKSGDG